MYFNYNTVAFGENISANNKIEYMQPTGYILGEIYDFPAYKDFIYNDNTKSRISISYQQSVSFGTIATNNVITTAKKLLAAELDIDFISETTGFSLSELNQLKENK